MGRYNLIAALATDQRAGSAHFGQVPGHQDDGSAHAAPLGHPDPPCLTTRRKFGKSDSERTFAGAPRTKRLGRQPAVEQG